MRLSLEMHDPEGTILQEIADRHFPQKTIAITYAFLMAQEEGKVADWSKINRAIMTRWSVSGLDRIKKQAWNIVKEWCQAGRAA